MSTAERVTRDISDNFVFQRSRLAYVEAAKHISGRVLEIGTGVGYGIEHLAPVVDELVTIDKFRSACVAAMPENVRFEEFVVPPLPYDDESFDCVVSFQVIEHIEEDIACVREVARVLRPGGKFVVSTPNAPMSLTRNPWHVREYNADELRNLLECHFSKVEAYGVIGNEKIMEYYRKNRQSVRNITRFDILDLQHRLPRKLLQIPYDLLNRLNRRSLHKKNTELTDSIVMSDYSIVPYEAGMECFDLFFVATK